MRAINYILAGALLIGCPGNKQEEIPAGKIKSYRTGNIYVHVEDDATYISVTDHKFVQFPQEADIYLVDRGNDNSFEKALARMKTKDGVKEKEYGETIAEILGRESLRLLGEASIEEFSTGKQTAVVYVDELMIEFNRLKQDK